MSDLYNELLELVIYENTIEEYKERRSLQEGVLEKIKKLSKKIDILFNNFVNKNTQQFLVRSKAEKYARDHMPESLKKELYGRHYITRTDLNIILDLCTPPILDISEKYKLEKMYANFDHSYWSSFVPWVNTFILISENPDDISKITADVQKIDKSIVSNKGKYKVTKIDTFVDKKNDGKDYIFVLVYLDNTYLK